jgi:hypothetical protein
MRIHPGAIAAAGLVLSLTACAGAPPQPFLTSFADIPVPEGMGYLSERSGVMDGATIKAARLVYRGRLEIESLSASMRQGLEMRGWRHVSTAKTSNQTITQVFDKPGGSIQVALWEGWWYTYLDVTVGKVRDVTVTGIPAR